MTILPGNSDGHYVVRHTALEEDRVFLSLDNYLGLLRGSTERILEKGAVEKGALAVRMARVSHTQRARPEDVCLPGGLDNVSQLGLSVFLYRFMSFCAETLGSN